MGRIFEKRKHTMFKRWDRMAKAFTRVGKEIAIAVRQGGSNADHNPALRRAIQNARAVNMPKDKVENAIKKASGDGATDYDELVYEGYAPHGVALLVETATDNPTRTVANVRLAFKKSNGNLGSTGSVAFMFERQGLFKVDPADRDLGELELELIDHGLLELEPVEAEVDDDLPQAHLRVQCAFGDFNAMQTALEGMGLEPLSSESAYVPSSTVELDDERAEEVLALVDRLEQDEDVQRVYHNLA